MVNTRELLSQVDLTDLVAGDLGQPVKHSGKYVFFRCPFHDDRDPSLAVTVDRYYCFGCRASGDAIDWLRNYRKMTFKDAIKALGGGQVIFSDKYRAISIPEDRTAGPEKTKPDELQASWREVIDVCQKQLWTDIGRPGREYLHQQRGLTDQTLKSPYFRIGFSTGQKIAGVWIDKGVVIPCFTITTDLEIDFINYIKVRRGQRWIYRPEDQSKYRKLPGHGFDTTGLYNADSIKGLRLVFVTEGEFDCMLLQQDAGDLVGVCTLGSASGKLDWSRWGKYFSFVKKLYICYDTDEAGDLGADTWQALSGRAVRVYVPNGKDITDYKIKSDGDLAKWILDTIQDDIIGEDDILAI